jgi:hypothetical protein
MAAGRVFDGMLGSGPGTFSLPACCMFQNMQQFKDDSLRCASERRRPPVLSGGLFMFKPFLTRD